jgi:radical SAM protein (TIGR01212 family)
LVIIFYIKKCLLLIKEVFMLYNKFSDYLKNRFGEKVWKVPVEAGFSCPNRDGFKGRGGCIYCNIDSFNGAEEGSIREQVEERIERLKKRKINKYIVYFQSYSNTYGSLDSVKERVEKSLVDDGIVAIHIGTRPDVIDDEKLEYFKELNEKYEVVIEYGLQSANDETLKYINRGHTVKEFSDAVELTHSYGIKTCAHVIFGLPGDTYEDMINSVKLVSALRVHSVKFHHLHVVKNTKLAKLYDEGHVKLMSESEYIKTLAFGLGHLYKDIVVARIVGDAAGESLVAPDWPKSKSVFTGMLEAFMKDNNIVQGCFD